MRYEHMTLGSPANSTTAYSRREARILGNTGRYESRGRERKKPATPEGGRAENARLRRLFSGGVFEFHQLAYRHRRDAIGDSVHVSEFDENMVGVQLLDHRSNLTFHHPLRKLLSDRRSAKRFFVRLPSRRCARKDNRLSLQ
ncbi:hypothetical protein p1B206 (plasmid) [Aromatoleum aromaticum EbN1]|uniref:Uncharacterized protein n=1 Tax=Aromatoleum aromaticum (strain DSM 19018 / LMG 30748 / EbN1) TaxID=76114 RepID=Q5NX14_AROAE|nr:hypothetical protein p1B206 [Aromatoleum aromaticum EbN1]